MRSKDCAITARTPSRLVPLAAQSREEPLPYSTPAKITSGTPSLLVFHGGVVDRHLFLRRVVDRVAALAAIFAQHVVADADIGEGAAHHHLMIAATCAVLVEVGDADAVVGEIFAGRRSRLDRAGRRDVVGGDLVAEQAEDARAS